MSRVFKLDSTLRELLIEEYGWVETKLPTVDRLAFIVEFPNGNRRLYRVYTDAHADLIPARKNIN